MRGKHVLLTSSGLTNDLKKIFFDIGKKRPEDTKVLYIPTAGIKNDSAREGIAVCLYELSLMGICAENILMYNLELIPSRNYDRTYSSYINQPSILTRLLTLEELRMFDAIFVGGGNADLLCREMVRTGFDSIILNGINDGPVYVGISAGSMYAAGNLEDGLHIIENPILPHWNGTKITELPNDRNEIKLSDGQAVYINDSCINLL